MGYSDECGDATAVNNTSEVRDVALECQGEGVRALWRQSKTLDLSNLNSNRAQR